MSIRYSTLVHGVTHASDGQESSFVESTTVRLESDHEAFIVLRNSPLPGSRILLEATLFEAGDYLVQARIRGQVICREGPEWRVAISPRSRLYTVPRSTSQ